MAALKWRILIAILLFAVPCGASTYVFVEDEVYESLYRLEAFGVIRSGLLTTRPLSRKEIVRLIREAEQQPEAGDPVIRQEIGFLKQRFEDDFEDAQYLKPIGQLRAELIQSDEDPGELIYNQDGDVYQEDTNLRVELSHRGELGWFSFHINPELRHAGDDTDAVLQRGYAVFSLKNLD